MILVTRFLEGLLLAAAFGCALTSGQSPARTPFSSGEELTYRAEISKALFKKLDVATFTFSTDHDSAANPSQTDSSTVAPQRYSLRFTADVASDGFFTRLFNVNFHQHVVSTVDPDSFAVQKTIKLDQQGKRVRTSEASFDQKDRKIVWTERDPNDPARAPRIITSDFKGQVNDIVSAIYYLRTQPLEAGNTLPVTISDSGRVYEVPVHVVEKRYLKTVLGRIAVVRIDAELFGEGGLVNSKGQFSVWLTDDYRHIPVSARIKSDFGTFDITLKKLSQQTSRAALERP